MKYLLICFTFNTVSKGGAGKTLTSAQVLRNNWTENADTEKELSDKLSALGHKNIDFRFFTKDNPVKLTAPFTVADTTIITHVVTL